MLIFTSMNAKNRPWCLTVLFAATLTVNVYAQLSNSPTPFYNYYYDYKLANPSFVGTKSKHLINTVYSGVAGESTQLLYASYERNIGSIKSGVGGLLLYDELGPATRVYYGLLYGYRLPFSETSGLCLGTQIFAQSRTIDYSDYQYLDPNDPPLIGSGTETNRSLNLDLGMSYYSPAITLGASMKNVMGREEETRTLNLLATRKFTLLDGLKAEPSILFFTDFEDSSVSINNILSSNNGYYLALVILQVEMAHTTLPLMWHEHKRLGPDHNPCVCFGAGQRCGYY